MVPAAPLRSWWAAALVLAGLGFLLVAVTWWRVRRTPAASGPSRLEWLASALLLALGVWLRVRDVGAMHGGSLTQDEVWLSWTYLLHVVQGTPVANGATYLTHAALLDAWHRLVGFWPMAPRWLSVTLGAAGLVCWWGFVARLAGRRTARWSTVVLACATYAIFFSKYALEPVYVLFALPLAGWLLLTWAARPGWARAVAAGLVLGASCFTYGGLLLGLVALAMGSGVALMEVAVRERRLPSVAGAWPSLVGLVVVAVGTLAAGLQLHRHVYSTGAVPFLGGGGVQLGFDAWLAGAKAYLADLLVATASWNLPYHGVPFLEPTLWPFAILGVARLWQREPRVLLRGILLSMPIAVLILPATGANPGMRRGIYLLLPFALASGAGLAAVLERVGPVLAALVIMVAFAHPLAYQLGVGAREGVESHFGHDFGGRALPEPLLLERLRAGPVLLSQTEYVHPWDRSRHVAFCALAERYGLLPPGVASLSFLEDVTPNHIAGAVVLTWRPDDVARAGMQRAGMCLVEDGDDWSADAPAVLRFVSPEDAAGRAQCAGDVAPPARCLELGGRNRRGRFAHAFSCEQAGCDGSRPQSVWVHPGTVTFRLRRSDTVPADRAALALWVLYAQVEQRANVVTVNGTSVGPLDASRLHRAIAVLPVPAEVAQAAVWEVRVGPAAPPRMGWDLYRAAAVSVDEIPRLPAEACPMP